jgi:hypothetical protein
MVTYIYLPTADYTHVHMPRMCVGVREVGECRRCWWILYKVFYGDYNNICVLLQAGGGLPQLQSHHPRPQESIFLFRFIVNNFIFTLTVSFCIFSLRTRLW